MENAFRRKNQERLKVPKSQGRDDRRFPVAAKIALETAGATGGTPGSPMPDGSSVEGTI
jgi:hypothetical protein